MLFDYNDQNLKPLRQTLRRNQTDAERKLWNAIRNRQLLGLKFIRQYSVGKYILDFYCSEKRLAIELDGGQHADEQNKKSDDERTAYLNQHDIKVIRFWNNDVLQNIEGVGESVVNELNPPVTHPYPSLTLREGTRCVFFLMALFNLDKTLLALGEIS